MRRWCPCAAPADEPLPPAPGEVPCAPMSMVPATVMLEPETTTSGSDPVTRTVAPPGTVNCDAAITARLFSTANDTPAGAGAPSMSRLPGSVRIDVVTVSGCVPSRKSPADTCDGVNGGGMAAPGRRPGGAAMSPGSPTAMSDDGPAARSTNSVFPPPD